METKYKILTALEQLREFFDQHKVEGWALRTERAIQNLNEGDANLEAVLTNYVGAGMGSIIDLIISTDNGHSLTQSEEETNKQFEKLTEPILIIKNGLNRNRKSH